MLAQNTSVYIDQVYVLLYFTCTSTYVCTYKQQDIILLLH